jgi:3-deoxy-D-manno-octulosonate 8-phosphate phosphatase (KDO 8-P phosphatase)
LIPESTSPELKRLAQGLQLLLLDVDGVLTDGGIILYGIDGEAKRFDVQDGMGVVLARAAGIKVGIITSRTSAVVQRRATELHLDEVLQGVSDKVEALREILEKYGLAASQAAYIGDDIQDIPIMRQVGLPISVQNARPLVKECCKCVTSARGGRGAVREAVEWLLELRGDKDKAYKTVIG